MIIIIIIIIIDNDNNYKNKWCRFPLVIKIIRKGPIRPEWDWGIIRHRRVYALLQIFYFSEGNQIQKGARYQKADLCRLQNWETKRNIFWVDGGKEKIQKDRSSSLWERDRGKKFSFYFLMKKKYLLTGRWRSELYHRW